MKEEEYEQKKQECWEEFKRTNLDGEVQWQPVSRYDVFCFAFDRAYALGREKEAITQEEIEKAAEEYAINVNDKRLSSYPEQFRSRLSPEYDMTDLVDAFAAGVTFALGKQDKDAESSSLWERLTDDEKREMQCRYHTNECVLRDHKKRTGDKAQSKAVARMKLLESLFGKENLKVEKK